MRLVQFADIERIVRKTVRSEIDYRCLLTGAPGSLGNFKFILGTTHADYTTPRHRHNFEQVRFQLGGSFDYDGIGTMKEGMVGYFPEGTAYGPSASGDTSEVLLLQHGGPNGSGYMSDSEYNVAYAALKERGTFRDGIYTVVGPDGRKRNKDGYEAVWEEANQRAVSYAKPRYDQPVLMRPENFAWMPLTAGAQYKFLGDFSECRLSLGFLKLDAGARAPLDERSLYFAVSGRGTANGTSWAERATIETEPGERIEIAAAAPSELYHIGLPDLSRIAGKTYARSEAAAV